MLEERASRCRHSRAGARLGSVAMMQQQQPPPPPPPPPCGQHERGSAFSYRCCGALGASGASARPQRATLALRRGRLRRGVALGAAAASSSSSQLVDTAFVRSSSKGVEGLLDWAQRNDFEFSALAPATFAGGLRGVALRRDVKEGEVYWWIVERLRAVSFSAIMGPLFAAVRHGRLLCVRRARRCSK